MVWPWGHYTPGDNLDGGWVGEAGAFSHWSLPCHLIQTALTDHKVHLSAFNSSSVQNIMSVPALKWTVHFIRFVFLKNTLQTWCSLFGGRVHIQSAVSLVLASILDYKTAMLSLYFGKNIWHSSYVDTRTHLHTNSGCSTQQNALHITNKFQLQSFQCSNPYISCNM